MTAPGDGQGVDTADAPGEWRDNPAFIELHSQDPRGNMEDRFDFQFVSGELLDDVGLDFVDGSHRVFGNDGTHTMGDAISSGTGATPMVLVALEENSDHLPVVVDYFIPLDGESACSADMVVEISATVRYYAPQIELASGCQVESGGMFLHFLSRLINSDNSQLLYQIVWREFPKSIRLLIDNKYVFQPFWEHTKGNLTEDEWQNHFQRSKASANRALGRMNTRTVLAVIFDRLYVLRNQLMHGSATWNSSVNRDQVRDSANILGQLVPAIISIMLDSGSEIWGDPRYPVVD